MKITKDIAETMLKNMREMSEKIYEDFPELKASIVANSWEDLDKINGYYINENSVISEHSQNTLPNLYNQNVFKTQKQAESSLAYAQLTQLMDNCGDCDVDWSYENGIKYCIEAAGGGIKTKEYIEYRCFLAFNTENIRNEFMEKHQLLIKTFYQI